MMRLKKTEEMVLLDYNDEAEFGTVPTFLTHIALVRLERQH